MKGWERFRRIPLPRLVLSDWRSHRRAADPSARLFSGIRRRLTIMYSCVLAAALLVSGIVLYVVVSRSLLGPVNGSLSNEARSLAAEWQTNALQPSPFSSCPSQGPQSHSVLVACFGRHGKLLGVSDLGQALPAFIRSPLLPRSAGSSRSDTVSTKGPADLSSIQRYAMLVPNPTGGGALGIIQVGAPVGAQATTLTTLLHLLLLLGGLTLVLSAGAGLVLANRALLPARIAYSRQRDFIADASHELRTPLTMLRSSIEFVLRRKDQLAPSDVALLEDTVQEAAHLTSLADNMLRLARLDSESIRIEEEIVDMGLVAAEVVRWTQANAAERQVRVEYGGADGVLVLGDRPLLEQVVLVLVDNAIKYNHEGGRVEVTLSVTGDQAALEVRDTGIGVEPQHVAHLGERFYRVDKARSRESGGAGLGLSIVRSIIARHQGEFHIVSRPGEGTAITVCLPSVTARPSQEREAEKQAESAHL